MLKWKETIYLGFHKESYKDLCVFICRHECGEGVKRLLIDAASPSVSQQSALCQAYALVQRHFLFVIIRD